MGDCHLLFLLKLVYQKADNQRGILAFKQLDGDRLIQARKNIVVIHKDIYKRFNDLLYRFRLDL